MKRTGVTTGRQRTMGTGRFRRRWLLTGVAALAVVSTLVAAGPAGAASAEELRVLALANQLRASVGAQPFVFDEDLAVTARRWAATLAAAGRIFHNPDLAVTNTGPTGVAENAGVGPNIQMVHDVLVGSPGHYKNLVNPTVTRVGIGVAWAGGRVYVVQNFLIVRGATAPASPPVTPAPAAARPTATTTSVPALRPAASTPPPTTVAAGAAAAVPPPPGAGSPSTWLTLSFDVLRAWDRASD